MSNYQKRRQYNVLYAREYRRKNQTKVNSYARDRYKIIREQKIAYIIAYNKLHKKKYYAYLKKWRQTLRGRLNTRLASIRKRCNCKSSHNYKYYGKKGIKCLLTINDMLTLWNRDNASKLERPSIDRINSNKSYTITNCRFIEHSENVSRSHVTRVKPMG